MKHDSRERARELVMWTHHHPTPQERAQLSGNWKRLVMVTNPNTTQLAVACCSLAGRWWVSGERTCDDFKEGYLRNFRCATLRVCGVCSRWDLKTIKTDNANLGRLVEKLNCEESATWRERELWKNTRIFEVELRFFKEFPKTPTVLSPMEFPQRFLGKSMEGL